jgi:hypothetical protein
LIHCCPAQILLVKAHDTDSTRVVDVGDVPGHERSNVVRHQNSVFHAVLKHLPMNELDRLVALHGADDRERGFDTKSHFVALLYAQLSGASSLREIEAGMKSHAGRLYHLGAVPARRSTLADANRLRPAAVFADLFARMVQQAHRGLRRSLAETTYLIDSTGVRLSGRGSEWARFSAKACGAKVHVIYDADAERPIYAAVTAAKVNDITAAQAMPIEAGATYVFDLGYYDYRWWAALDAAGCRIVTRFKTNTPLTCIEERPVPEGGTVLSDRIGRLPPRQAASRRNPFGEPVREVRVGLDTGKVLRILSNDLLAPAREIADLYKRRPRDRAVLPLGQTDAEDHPLPRHLRERRARPDRRGADRLPPAPSRTGDPARRRKPARLRPPRPNQPDAPARPPQPPAPAPHPTDEPQSARPPVRRNKRAGQPWT